MNVLTKRKQNLKSPPKDSSLTPEFLYALRRKLIETQKLNAALISEKKRNEAQIAKLKSLLQPSTAPKREPRSSTSPSKASQPAGNGNGNGESTFAFLTHTPAAQALGVQALPRAPSGPSKPAPESHTPLTTHTTFTTSQLPYLRQLLATLKPHLPTTALPPNTSGKAGEKEEVTRERKAYVESQSKRILERRGVDTRDGVEGVWEGSRVRSEEVRGLEGVVEGLERGKVERGDGSVEKHRDQEGDGDEMDLS